MQEQISIGPAGAAQRGSLPNRGLVALLALVGSRRTTSEALRARTGLAPQAFFSLMSWLQRERLVIITASLERNGARETMTLTGKGESVLLGLLERTCELPDLE